MKTILQKTTSFVLSVLLICFILPVRADASFEIPGTCRVQTDTGAVRTVKLWITAMTTTPTCHCGTWRWF